MNKIIIPIYIAVKVQIIFFFISYTNIKQKKIENNELIL